MARDRCLDPSLGWMHGGKQYSHQVDIGWKIRIGNATTTGADYFG
jgi:hypothetical protein